MNTCQIIKFISEFFKEGVEGGVKKLSFGLCSRGKASASETERDTLSRSLSHHIDLILIASAPSSFGINHSYLVPSASIVLATALEYDCWLM